MRPRRNLSSTVVFPLVYAAALLLLAAIFLASRVLDRPVESFTKDPTEVLDAPAYIGFLTSVATILWSAAATSCLLAWIRTGRDVRSPFLWGGLVVTVLLVDDVFRFHESYYPALFGVDAEGSLGAPQVVLRAAYALMVVVYMWIFRDFLRANGALLFLLGFALLGTGAAIDALTPDEVPFIREEASKFLAIVTWMLFFVRAALRAIGGEPSRQAAVRA